MAETKEYYAFISYKREDEKWAKWLQHKLEHYRLPSNLNGRTDLPHSIRPIFRDVTDLTPGFLSAEIDDALRNSEWLIIICSPRSAKSPWVCKEAQTFVDLGRADRIIPFIIEGMPFSQNLDTECYPEALLNLTGGSELLAAKINEMGRDVAFIKVVARMFNLRFDTLWQRYNREKRRIRRWTFIGVILFAFLCLSIGGRMYQLNRSLSKQIIETNQQREIADLERERAELVTDSLLVISDSLVIQSRLIQSQNIQLQDEREKTLRSNRRMQINRANFISEEAMQLIDKGDTYRAIALLLEILPTPSNPDRPKTIMAEKALRVALDSIDKIGYVPIAVLDYKHFKNTYYESVDGFYFDEASRRLWVRYVRSDDAGEAIVSYNIDNGSWCESYAMFDHDGYRDVVENLNFESFPSERCDDEYYLDDNKYKLVVHDKSISLYKYNNVSYISRNYILPRYTDIYSDSLGPEGNTIIVGDSIYDFWTGRALREVGLSGYTCDEAQYTSDGKYVVALNDTVFSVKDAITGELLKTLDVAYLNINYIDFNLKGSILYVSEEYAFSLPFLEACDNVELDDCSVIKNKDPYEFEYDSEKNVLTLKDRVSGNIIKTFNIDLGYLENPQEYYSFYLIGENHLWITSYYNRVIFDLNQNKIIGKSFNAPNRYCGSMFNSNKEIYVTFAVGGPVNIYDTMHDELLASYSWPGGGSVYPPQYSCCFTKDEKYIIFMFENEWYLMDMFNSDYNRVEEYCLYNNIPCSAIVVRWYSLLEIIDIAVKKLQGRTLSPTEKSHFYVE